MTKMQRLIVLMAAVAVGVRVFLPIQYVVSGRERILISYWPGLQTQAAPNFSNVYPVTDIYTTALQVLGIAAIASALCAVVPVIPSSRRAKMGVLIGLITLVAITGGIDGWNYWRVEQSKRLASQPHGVTRPLEPNPRAIVEGQRIGVVAVGMSLDEVRRKVGKPLTSASKDRTGVTAYWDAELGRWIVHFDGTTPKATSVGFVAWKTGEEDLARIPFETTKGVRYGQSAETVRALYGEPARTHKELDLSVLVFNKPSFPKSYYYPGIAFLFQCVGLQKASDCVDDFYTLYRVTVYASGFAPDWVR